jgi:glycogen synthase
MNIALLTNTFTPHVGGVARSVESFAKAYRELGHRVLVVAPEFDDAPERKPMSSAFQRSSISTAVTFRWCCRYRADCPTKWKNSSRTSSTPSIPSCLA